MGWSLLRLSAKILALLRLLGSSRDEFRDNVRPFFPQGQSKLSFITSCPYLKVLSGCP